MISILHPEPELSPAVRNKVRRLRLAYLSSTLAGILIFLLAVFHYLPKWTVIFGFCLYTVGQLGFYRRFRSLLDTAKSTHI